jgi:cardiolipin synthase
MTVRESHNAAHGHVTGLANLLTYARMAAIPLMVACYFLPGNDARWTVLALFIFAAVTDFFDGYVARAWGQQSRWGQMLDPIADKLLVSTTIVLLVAWNTIGGLTIIPAIVILCREILVSGLREFLASVRVGMPVTILTKWKTAIQLIALALLIIGPAGGEDVVPYTTLTGETGLWIAAILTFYTGFDYFKAGFRHATNPKLF